MRLTQSDIPALVSRIRTTVESKDLRLIDATRVHIPNLDAFKQTLHRLLDHAVIILRWDPSFEQNSSNDLFSKDETRVCLPLIMVCYKLKTLLIHEEQEIPNSNFHILVENLLIMDDEVCVSCMETKPNLIPCNTCYNSTYCDDCMLDAMDTGQENCPLCRCDKYSVKSFLGAMGNHPTLFNKLKARNNPYARELVQLLETSCNL